MKLLKEKLAIIVILISLVSAAFGAFFWVEKRYALAESMRQLEQRVDYKIKTDQIRAIQERIWTIEDREGTNPRSPTVREELRRLRQTKESLEMQLKELQKK